MVGAGLSEDRTIIRGPDGQTWQEAPPNSPVRAKPDWLLKQQMDEANAKPIPRSCFAVELQESDQQCPLPSSPQTSDRIPQHLRAPVHHNDQSSHG
jgi:hypothetical protein